MKLIFIRHGQTNYNLKDLCNGRPNPRVRLTPLGLRQAAKAARLLKNEQIEKIYTSKLFRSRQTALIINKYHKAPMHSDARLNDRSMGIFEDMPAGLFYTWRDKQKNPWTCKPQGGESYESVKRRFKSFLTELAKENKETILIVTHLPILKIARGYFKHLSNKSMDSLTEKDIPNCTVFRFTIQNSKKKTKS